MLNGTILDLWDAPYPRLNNKSGIKYNHRLIWCSLPHIEDNPFYCKQLVAKILELYDVKLHHFTVAAFLKKLENLGYIERIRVISSSALYQYRMTQLYRKYWKEAWKRE